MKSKNLGYHEQINVDLYYYEHIHRRKPEKIFISYPLWSIFVLDDGAQTYYNMQSLTYNGIPVQVYISDKLEYYFASSGFVFEDED